MKKATAGIALALGALILLSPHLYAAEHPGKTVEHPGSKVEQKGKPITADTVKKAIEDHAREMSKAHGGFFMVRDEKLNKNWQLTFVKVHDPVRTFQKDGQTVYFACSDFKSADGKDLLDIDFWMVPKGDKLEVIDTKIHKVNGEPRYTYEGVEIKEIK
ncbi:MAG TPA: hypothetical protein VMT71_08335 [Syntrophorhabdales bacterium]|nr:hypothetical protein [Syntrophorhabdales bacterium]